MLVGFKMQIYPTKEQEDILKEYCKAFHMMWNHLVAKYQDELPVVLKYGIENYKASQLMEECGFNIPSRIATGVIATYSIALKRFYNRLANKPKFHKYNPNKQSFYLSGMTYLVDKGFIIMPSTQKGNASKSRRIYLNAEYLNKYNITEVIEPRYTCYKGKWYLSGSYNVSDVQKVDREVIGLDWGIKNFMTTSDGEFINYPESVLREYQRIKNLRRKLDKKIKYSNNYYELFNKIQRAYDRLEGIKCNFIDQKTTELCRNNSIAVEKIDNLIGEKSFINRQNTISPRGRFVDKLKWKCEKFGSYFVEVNPAHTTQVCSKCGQLHKLSLNDRMMICDCGNIMDRDMNAAINIKNEGEKILSSMDIGCIY